MCGIVGFSSKKNNKNILQDMLTTLKHRGPDDQGEYYNDNISFGHHRLSIIDIENGKQPFISQDGRYALIFNGEIYNYLELRQQLLNKGYNFKTFSDTEVLLNMYIEYKEKSLNYLNGMFAYAIYDNIKKTIFIARDHFGIKPLYYYQGKNIFAFASEIKALLQHPEIKPEIDYQSLNEYLTFQFILKKHTLFKNINKLEPATYIIVKDNKIIEKKEYWHLDYNVDDSKSKDQFADELLVLLENSLMLQVRSDVPVGAYLSGGIDSSIVSVLASKNYFGDFKTFSGAFKESSDYDETNYSNIIHKFINSKHYKIYPTYKDFISCFEKLVYHMDEPGAGNGIFPQYMVSKIASENVKVVLGGQGGDEIFGGYARYAVAYLEQCLKGAIFETQEEGQHVVTLNSIINNLPLLKKYLPLIKFQFSSGMFDDMNKRYYQLIDRSPNLKNIYNDELIKNRNEEELFDKFNQIFNKPDTKSYFNKMTYFDQKTLLQTLLQVEDRVSMAVSLESRVPLLDKRIVELAAKIPPTLKFAGGKTKYMLIESVRNILPKEIINRKDKMGFPTPFNDWIKGPLKEYILDIFLSKKTKERSIFNIEEIEKQIMYGEQFSRDIWGALNIEIWLRTFID